MNVSIDTLLIALADEFGLRKRHDNCAIYRTIRSGKMNIFYRTEIEMFRRFYVNELSQQATRNVLGGLQNITLIISDVDRFAFCIFRRALK